MPHGPHTPGNALEVLFLALQLFNVLFLLLHDWVPLGRLNNYAAKKHEDTMQHRMIVTLLGALPAGVGLYFCARNFAHHYPHWLGMYLAITYGIFFLGLLRAWWIPYLILPDPVRAARYQIIFAGTHAFLPRRNGIVPDTLHTIFHLSSVATLVLIFVIQP